MKNQKKWELLKYAYDNYPKGAIWKWSKYGGEIKSTGIFEFNEGRIATSEGFSVYDGVEWAEIITEQPKKIAVQVNLNQSKILAKHLGVEHNLGEFTGEIAMYLEDLYPELIKGKCNYDFVTNVNLDNYTIIPFDTFAKEHNIKLPLLTSEDGVDLYEGDANHVVSDRYGSWTYMCHNSTINLDHNVVKNQKTYKAFVNKEAALKWIEEQKPKSKEVKLFNGGTANVYKEYIMIHGGIKVMPSDMEEIARAFKELS